MLKTCRRKWARLARARERGQFSLHLGNDGGTTSYCGVSVLNYMKKEERKH
jgi:hypothetical protein